jgi:carboxymethylenebutenolidase
MQAKIDIGNTYMGGYVAQPQGTPLGSLLVIQEIFGVTPAMHAIADDFAAEGCVALVPDIYWRVERDLDLGNGEDSIVRQKAVDLSNKFDEDLGVSDLSKALTWLHAESKLGRKPAVLGFCLGGRLAVRVAAASDPSCVISMYGVKVDVLAAEIDQIACPMQFHFGENDNHNPIATINKVRGIVERKGRPVDEFFTYPGVEHAFYNRFRLDRFNEKAHRLARSRVLAFLQRNLISNRI